jgi:hypothetical protein
MGSLHVYMYLSPQRRLTESCSTELLLHGSSRFIRTDYVCEEVYKTDNAIPFPMISNLPILPSTNKARLLNVSIYSGFMNPLT